MGVTYTTNYGLEKSTGINDNFDVIDAQMKANEELAGKANATDIVLVPEMPGAGWFDGGSPDAIDDTTGSVKFDGSNQRNCYVMKSSATTKLLDFTLQVEVELPVNFAAWKTSAILIDLCTESNQSTQTAIDAAVHRNRSVAATWSSPSPYVSDYAGIWKTVTVTSTDLGGAWTAGDTLTLKLKSKSMNNLYVKIGKVKMQYQ